MKKLVLYIVVTSTLVVSISSCSPRLSPTERVVISTVLDFRKYNAEGFFISSTPYMGLYDPLGQIRIGIIPAKTVKVTTIDPVRNRYSSATTTTTYEYENEEIVTDELLAIIVSEAKKLGADGVVNVTISRSESYHYLTGLAIKRR